MKKKVQLFPAILAILLFTGAEAQMVTGVWKGKINRQKAEIKIIQNGDSLTGTAYYYESPANYRRYSIKGYFDAVSNEVVWWDDQLLEEKSGRFGLSSPGKVPLLSRADFNCPGGGKMMLDGKSGRNEEELKGDVHLDKIEESSFADEWDYVLDNYLVGTNDPYIIDSIANLRTSTVERSLESEKTPEVTSLPIPQEVEKEKVPQKDPEPVAVVTPVRSNTIEEKFTKRKKMLITEIPVKGDSIELRFYDNAEIDGDSISLFLNDRLIFEHIRLTGSAYSIKLAVSDLEAENELIMVAENLGSIPPNTSYMVAVVDNKKYEARLVSTEGSSAMVKFVKKGSQ